MEFNAFRKTETFLEYAFLIDKGLCFYAALVVSLTVSKFKIESLKGWNMFLKSHCENDEVSEENDFYGFLEQGLLPYTN